MTPELSIIVPVYKVEDFLPHCIESILAQTFQNYELILVDDGSPDGCGKICDEYAAKDERILVIHQANAGVSAARNAGLDIVRGKYIGFVDADDWLEPDMYEKLMQATMNDQYEIVISGISYCTEDFTAIRDDLTTELVYSGDLLIRELFGMPNRVGGAVYNKIFLYERFRDCRFECGVSMAEDWLYLFHCFEKCDKANKIADALYHVVERQGSATRTNTVAMNYELLSSSKLLLLLLLARRHSLDLERYAMDKYLDDCMRYLPELKQTGQSTGQPYRRKVWHIKGIMLRQMFRAWRLKLLPKAKLHGYLYGWLRL